MIHYYKYYTMEDHNLDLHINTRKQQYDNFSRLALTEKSQLFSERVAEPAQRSSEEGVSIFLLWTNCTLPRPLFVLILTPRKYKYGSGTDKAATQP